MRFLNIKLFSLVFFATAIGFDGSDDKLVTELSTMIDIQKTMGHCPNDSLRMVFDGKNKIKFAPFFGAFF